MNTVTKLVEKWKPLLEWSSSKYPPVAPEEWELLATRLEYFENKYRKYPKFLSRLIPVFRALEGDISIVHDMIDGHICGITQGPDEDGNITTIAIPMVPDQDLTSWGPPMMNYYHFKNGVWEWI